MKNFISTFDKWQVFLPPQGQGPLLVVHSLAEINLQMVLAKLQSGYCLSQNKCSADVKSKRLQSWYWLSQNKSSSMKVTSAAAVPRNWSSVEVPMFLMSSTDHQQTVINKMIPVFCDGLSPGWGKNYFWLILSLILSNFLKHEFASQRPTTICLAKLGQWVCK